MIHKLMLCRVAIPGTIDRKIIFEPRLTTEECEAMFLTSDASFERYSDGIAMSPREMYAVYLYKSRSAAERVRD
jgi:hypothetical protein